MSCPLCQSDDNTERETFPVGDLVHEYRRQLGIDVAQHFPDRATHLTLANCGRCGLQFFTPSTPGSPDFYQQICAIDGYYADDRWEFSVVAGHLRPESSVVDVGCGGGRFLSRLPNRDKLGLEHNPAAIAIARKRGVDVQSRMLADLPSESADAITLFQVLEHLEHPRPVLEAAWRVLRPGGRLFLAVPNNDGFVGALLHAPLNAPPHHVLRWGRQPLAFIASLLPLQVEFIECEPLPAAQLFDHRRAWFTRRLAGLSFTRPTVCARSGASVVIRKIATALTFASLRLNRSMPRKAVGHTILAAYRRRS